MKSHFVCGHPREESNIYRFVEQGRARERCIICRKEHARQVTMSLATYCKPDRPKTEKYRGQKAGTIVIGRGTRWGASLLSDRYNFDLKCSKCHIGNYHTTVEANGQCIYCNGNTYRGEARRLLAFHDTGAMTSSHEWAALMRKILFNFPVEER